MLRRAFTLIELIVSIGLAALLIAILLPAVHGSREAARKAQCRSKLRQIALGVHSYESVYGMLPACQIRSVSWHVAILPQIDQADLFQQVDYSAADPTSSIASVVVPLYLCDSDTAPAVSQGGLYAATNYLGNSGTGVLASGYNGVFENLRSPLKQFTAGPVYFSDITDGAATTAMVSEVLHSVFEKTLRPADRLRAVFNTPSAFEAGQIDEFHSTCASIPTDFIKSGWKAAANAHGWRWVTGNIGYSTYNHALTPMQPSCYNQRFVQTGIFTAASGHSSLVNVAFADGHVQSVTNLIDIAIWNAIGSRNGSESLGTF